MRSTLVNPEAIDYVWPQVEEFIHSAFEAQMGDETQQGVVEMLHNDLAQLWVAHDHHIKGAAITRIDVVPNGRKICFCVACGGTEFSEWGHLIADIEQWAQSRGCYAVRISGRPGWKIYKKRGYKEPFVILEKAL